MKLCSRTEALNAGQHVPQQINRACSGFKNKERCLSLKNSVKKKKFDGMRIRTALAELIYIPSISNLMLLEEGLSLPLPLTLIRYTALVFLL